MSNTLLLSGVNPDKMNKVDGGETNKMLTDLECIKGKFLGLHPRELFFVLLPVLLPVLLGLPSALDRSIGWHDQHRRRV